MSTVKCEKGDRCNGLLSGARICEEHATRDQLIGMLSLLQREVDYLAMALGDEREGQRVREEMAQASAAERLRPEAWRRSPAEKLPDSDAFARLQRWAKDRNNASIELNLGYWRVWMCAKCVSRPVPGCAGCLFGPVASSPSQAVTDFLALMLRKSASPREKVEWEVGPPSDLSGLACPCWHAEYRGCKLDVWKPFRSVSQPPYRWRATQQDNRALRFEGMTETLARAQQHATRSARWIARMRRFAGVD